MVEVKHKKNQTKKKSKKNSAPKANISFRRNLLPPLVGLVVMLIVFIILNGQWLEAQAKYRFAKPLPVVSTASTSTFSTKSPDPSAGPQLSIPAIDAKAPIVFEQSTADWAVQLALRNGVDHYGGTANPGQSGNTVIFGHSSGQLWAPGNYKFVFTLLNKVKAGDQVTIDYQGTRYAYKVTSTEIILPSNLSILNQASSKPTLTLVTCTPVGTSKYRFVVHADQISPTPVASAKPAVSSSVRAQPLLPGSAHASFWSSVTSWL